MRSRHSRQRGIPAEGNIGATDATPDAHDQMPAAARQDMLLQPLTDYIGVGKVAA